jgi:hypothetical protein
MQKSLLRQTALRWFVSGAALATGAFTVFVAFVVLIEPLIADFTDKRKRAEFTTNTGQFIVEKIEPFTITTKAGVRAVIRNNGTIRSKPDRITLAIARESKVLFTCSVHAETFIGPGESATEQLLCPEVVRVAVPAEATYTLVIGGAWNAL